MRKIYFLVLLMGMFAIGNAQTFSVYPATTVNTMVDPSRSADAHIYFPNSMQQGIYLIWEVTNSSYPNQWFMTVCDNASCYSLPHMTDSMAVVAVGDSGFLKVACNPYGVAGTGTISFHVYDKNNPISSTNVTFNFTAQEVTAVTGAQFAGQFGVSPVPADGYLHLNARNGLLEKGSVALFDLQGARVLQQVVSAVPVTEILVGDLKPGIYLMRYESKSGMMTKKVVIAH